MEEEEIELWYEEQKQQLTEKYLKSIDRGMRLEKREKHFNKVMDTLAKNYQAKHTSFKRKKESAKRRKSLFKALSRPFVYLFKAFISLLVNVGSFIKTSTRARCGQLYFNAGLVWIRNGYKIPQTLSRIMRPLFYLYVKYLQKPLIILMKPFRYIGRLIKQAVLSIGGAFAKAGRYLWAAIKKSAKAAAKTSLASYKAVSTRIENISKRYNEWYAKRLQASLERKQARKEAREKKLKAKEEAKQAKITAEQPPADKAPKEAGETIDKDLDESQADLTVAD